MKHPTPRSSPPTILLIEDTPSLQLIYRTVLQGAGHQVRVASSATEGMAAFVEAASQVVLLDLGLPDRNGLDMIHEMLTLRPGTRIIVITANGSINKAVEAMRAGAHEFLVKPFSTKTLYNRLEQIIDNPRSFVFSSAYVGPERRRRGEPPAGVNERRTTKPQVKTSAQVAMGSVPTDTPVIYAPDFTLRKALGVNTSLAQMITPDVLAEAQQAIDVLVKDSLSWISEDLKTLEAAAHSLSLQYLSQAIEQAKEASLSIKARSGTFGYVMASDVARLLYLFLSSNYSATNPKHLIVMQKHIDVLKVIFAKGIKLREGIGNDLYAELERLIATHK